jgi:hypothetical protein
MASYNASSVQPAARACARSSAVIDVESSTTLAISAKSARSLSEIGAVV